MFDVNIDLEQVKRVLQRSPRVLFCTGKACLYANEGMWGQFDGKGFDAVIHTMLWWNGGIARVSMVREITTAHEVFFDMWESRGLAENAGQK